MRRRIVLAGATALAAALLPLTTTYAAGAPTPATPQVTAPSTWTQRGADAAMSNYNPNEKELNSTSILGLEPGQLGLQPQFSLAKVSSFQDCGATPFAGDLPVSDGTDLYWFDGLRVRANALSDGATRWRAPILDSFGLHGVSQLAVSDGRVFARVFDCGSVSEPIDSLYVYSATTGALLWRKTGIEPALGAMLVAGGHVLVTSRVSNGAGPTTWSYDVTDGSLSWQQACGGWRSPTLFTIGGVVPLEQCGDASLGQPTTSGGLSLGTGSLLWTKALGYRYTRGDSSVVAAPNAYLTDLTGHVVAMTPAGTRVWRAGLGTVLAAGPRNVFTDCGTATSICALNRTTGALVWKKNVVSNAAGAAVAGNVVYPYQLNATTGADLATDFFAPHFFGRSGVAGGRVWVENGRTLDVYGLETVGLLSRR